MVWCAKLHLPCGERVMFGRCLLGVINSIMSRAFWFRRHKSRFQFDQGFLSMRRRGVRDMRRHNIIVPKSYTNTKLQCALGRVSMPQTFVVSC